MRKIIPTIFAKTKKEFDEKFGKLKAISKELQVDFMDGKFVKSKGINLEDVPTLQSFKNKFEAHLMVRDPLEWIPEIKSKGFKKVLFHYQGVRNEKGLQAVIDSIKNKGMEAWIVFNPEIDINDIFWAVDGLNGLDGIMFMGVNPGKENQALIEEVVSKIEVFKLAYARYPVQIDGGINALTAKKLVKAGADILNSGSFVGNSKNPKKSLDLLKKAISD